jgi:trimethylamine--corrinoid protein Co-methyltransferase
MDLAAMAFGGPDALRRKPRLITLVNTHSPLQIDPETLDTLRVHAEYNQPLVITGGVTGGATGPVTRAGALAQSNAEVLAAIAVAQLLRPGLPVVMGVVASPANMFTAGGHLGAPDYAAGVRYAKGLATRYGIPCRCGGCVTDAPGLTSQAGCESMMNMLVTLQEQVDLIVHGAGILASFKGIGFEKFILDMEIIRMIEHLREEIEVDDDSLALEAIAAAGHGGQFLTLPHTLHHCRQAAWTSPIFSAKPLRAGGTAQDDQLARVRCELDRRLAAYRPPAMEPGLRTELEAFLTGTGVAPELFRQLDDIAER